MLTFSAEWVDVAKHLLDQVQPVALIKRSKVGEWMVPVTPLVEPDVQFSTSKMGEAVRVPMNAYDTSYRLPSAILGLGVQIGMVAILEMMKHVRDAPLHVKLVLGTQVTDLSPAEEKYRVYIGIAIQTK